MNIYFNPAEWRRLYRCDHLNETQWQEYSIQHPNAGLLCLSLGIVYLFTYVPCLTIMRQRQFYENSCFKLMFLHGCIDVMAIIINSFISGYLFIIGTTYCDFPNLQYFAGLLAVAGWCGQCLNCVFLAINRCVDFLAPNLSTLLFEGPRTFLVYVVVLSYMMVLIIFGRPIFFYSGAFMWLYDPYILVPTEVIPVDRSLYRNYIHDWNNYITIPAMFILYTILIASISFKTRGTAGQLKVQLQLLRQAGLICLLNFIPGTIFIAAQFVPTPPFMIFVCLITWQLGNGGGGLILLTLNKTIRDKVLEMLFGSRFRSSCATGSKVGPTVSAIH
ncbi:hypothetical protein L596_025310 [Steinernema carpocapsae]|uniref:G-protein coupled receptors family 1 profile domain-containing protein n=1 Tax=Steinernema carpocapsae TaxID=34508 RepID=A0A4U5M7L3_STECR|nr:hypothetical protein L596_025310 [Steinernema carpocapsae]